MVGGFGAGVRQIAYLVGHDGKAFARFPRPRGLDGGVDGDQVGGGGDIQEVSGVTGAAESTRGLVDDMAGITAGMDTNQEIVGAWP